jgi:hypothetical protein
MSVARPPAAAGTSWRAGGSIIDTLIGAPERAHHHAASATKTRLQNPATEPALRMRTGPRIADPLSGGMAPARRGLYEGTIHFST